METIAFVLLVILICFIVTEYFFYTQFDRTIEIQYHRNIIMREKIKQEKEHLEFLKLKEIELKMDKKSPGLFENPVFQPGPSAPEINKGEPNILFKNGIDQKAMEAKINMMNNLL